MNDFVDDDDDASGFETDLFTDVAGRTSVRTSPLVPVDERWSSSSGGIVNGGGASITAFHRGFCSMTNHQQQQQQQRRHLVHLPIASRGLGSPPSLFSSLPATRAGSPLSAGVPPLSSTPPGLHSSSNGRCCEFPPIFGQHLTTQVVNGGSAASRRRFNSGSGDSLHRLVDGCSSSSNRCPTTVAGRLRVSRDPTQPSSGSLRSLHSMSNEGSADDEESDEFPVACSSSSRRSPAVVGGFLSVSLVASPSSSYCPNVGGHRPRASTCPETKAFRRRALARAMNRPPTPTPLPVECVDAQNGSSGAAGAVDGDDDDDYDGDVPTDDEDDRGSWRPTTTAARSSSCEDVDGCGLGRRLHIGDAATRHGEQPPQPTTRRFVHVNGTATGNAIRLPPLYQDGVVVGTTGGLMTGSGGRPIDRTCTGIGHAIVGSTASDVLPVITET